MVMFIILEMHVSFLPRTEKHFTAYHIIITTTMSSIIISSPPCQVLLALVQLRLEVIRRLESFRIPHLMACVIINDWGCMP